MYCMYRVARRHAISSDFQMLVPVCPEKSAKGKLLAQVRSAPDPCFSFSRGACGSTVCVPVFALRHRQRCNTPNIAPYAYASDLCIYPPLHDIPVPSTNTLRPSFLAVVGPRPHGRAAGAFRRRPPRCIQRACGCAGDPLINPYMHAVMLLGAPNRPRPVFSWRCGVSRGAAPAATDWALPP